MLTNLGLSSMRPILETVVSSDVDEAVFLHNPPSPAVAMEIDPDPEKQRCEGILAATGAAGADVGAKVGQELLWGFLCHITY